MVNNLYSPVALQIFFFFHFCFTMMRMYECIYFFLGFTESEFPESEVSCLESF